MRFMLCLIFGHKKWVPLDKAAGAWFMKWEADNGLVAAKGHLCPRCKLWWWEEVS